MVVAGEEEEVVVGAADDVVTAVVVEGTAEVVLASKFSPDADTTPERRARMAKAVPKMIERESFIGVHILSKDVAFDDTRHFEEAILNLQHKFFEGSENQYCS